VKNKIQLITYPDSLGGSLVSLNDLLTGSMSGIFEGGVHILPPFPSTGDRGFAPITYRQIEPRFGSWEDIKTIGEHHAVMVDIMVNHISRYSSYFQDFLQHGRQSQYADMFITLDKVWPDGSPPEEDVSIIFKRKPEHPFLDVEIETTGETERIWASFGPRADHSEQIDLDVHSPLTRQFFTDLFQFLKEQNIHMIRLDAIGYVIKKAGTSCFMVEPEIYQFMEWIEGTARDAGIELLPEVHAHYATQFRLAEQGYRVYDFVLPMLILHTLETRDAEKLVSHLHRCPRKQISMLDCHDGIPVQPDLDDILTIKESKHIVEQCLKRGANLNRIISKEKTKDGFDAHQINITYYDALGQNDDAYIAARAIQFFAPGVPQVYYVGLLAGVNDNISVDLTGEGRAINRHNYTLDEIQTTLEKDVVQRLLSLIRFRNQHPAFDGQIAAIEIYEGILRIRWELDAHFAQLVVDLESYKTEIISSGEKIE
jgi:sucrose phosphorylase